MEKESVKEQLRFLEIAKGSAAEFATQVSIGMDVGSILTNMKPANGSKSRTTSYPCSPTFKKP
uniref:four helix bundle protein n=1 Tax=Thiomicrolovo subterrani TaxID=3131934 RepID=UPI003F629F85